MKTSSPGLGFSAALLLAAISSLSGGCANLANHGGSGGPMVVVETENVYVTGSHIPVRVAKSAISQPTPGISPLTILTADDMRRAFGAGPPPMH